MKAFLNKIAHGFLLAAFFWGLSIFFITHDDAGSSIKNSAQGHNQKHLVAKSGTPCVLSPEGKPYYWVYWENVANRETPGFISLCRKTMHKHCDASFTVVDLNPQNIYNYLPELKEKEKQFDLARLTIAQRVDYYRILLLEKYGGMYTDADTLVMRDMKEVADKLAEYDFVGWGAFNGLNLENYYGKPENGLMASRAHGILISSVLKNIEKQVLKKTNLDYFDLGRGVIELTLTPLLASAQYKYFHYINDIDGSCDKNGKGHNMIRWFSNEKIEYTDVNKLLFIVLFNAEITNAEITDGWPVKKMTEEQLLAQDTNFARYVKLSLGM